MISWKLHKINIFFIFFILISFIVLAVAGCDNDDTITLIQNITCNDTIVYFNQTIIENNTVIEYVNRTITVNQTINKTCNYTNNLGLIKKIQRLERINKEYENQNATKDFVNISREYYLVNQSLKLCRKDLKNITNNCWC